MDTLNAYLATHFFNEAEFEWTAKIGNKIRKETGINLYIPQENGEINDKKNNDDKITDILIYEGDTNRLATSDILLACLDGVEIDSGVAAEIGWFAGTMETEKQKPRIIIGLYTDMRQDGTGDNHLYRNLYVTGAIRKHGVIVRTVDEVIDTINKFKHRRALWLN